MLLTIFRFLDTDGSGDIDPEEFRLGIELLNKRLPEESHFQEHEELFQLLDVDGNGTIDIMEFEKIFVDD
jgi:Ca2+-binding EF-hand superfamily protein